MCSTQGSKVEQAGEELEKEKTSEATKKTEIRVGRNWKGFEGKRLRVMKRMSLSFEALILMDLGSKELWSKELNEDYQRAFWRNVIS